MLGDAAGVNQVDWLATCIALRVVGDVFVIFLRRWHTICTVLQPMGSKGPIPEEILKPADQ